MSLPRSATCSTSGMPASISKKRRISNKIMGNAGEPMGQPPFMVKYRDPNGLNIDRG